MLEGYLPAMTVGNWRVLGSGNCSRNGQHSYGDHPDVPAGDPMSAGWEYTNWVAFPGKEGDGSDCTPEVRAAVENFYKGKKCALLYKESSASSYHFRSGDYYFLIDVSEEEDRQLYDAIYDLDGEGFGLWPFKSNAGSRSVVNPSYEKPDLFEEFVYNSFAQLEALALDRSELDNMELPRITLPKPEETSDAYWDRQITHAQAPDWTKKRDGD